MSASTVLSAKKHGVVVVEKSIPDDDPEYHAGSSPTDETPRRRRLHLRGVVFRSYVHVFTFLVNPRCRFPIFGFIIGIAIGYAMSMGHIYRPTPSVHLSRPIVSETGTTSWGADYFYPAVDEERYPAVPSYNVLKETSTVLAAVRESIVQRPVTPLFVPFTRNFGMLRQTVLSYIAAGWPREQIYVIDNSGTMDANFNNLLSDKNPFYLDYGVLRGRYGVNIVRTPTLFSFAQLQNFMLATAMNRRWTHFYWTHQDVAVLSDETKNPYSSLYENILTDLVELAPKMTATPGERWGIVWYDRDYDLLTLVNVGAAVDVGAWDPFIPYDATDCDYYERMRLSGLLILDRRVGDIWDVSKPLKTPERAFFTMGDTPGSPLYQQLTKQLEEIMLTKVTKGRNTWQDEQKGGKGEPWTYDPVGFQKAWWSMARAGRGIYANKWGVNKVQCQPSQEGRTLDSIWRMKEAVQDDVTVVEEPLNEGELDDDRSPGRGGGLGRLEPSKEGEGKEVQGKEEEPSKKTAQQLRRPKDWLSGLWTKDRPGKGEETGI
ncbi:hypothetical protein Dda_6402 [Drechslerella dactyloides]|uniref:Uncharacterized protein n=1 Tax=Drechslerella dactyloides TaxID=74499 RepID=A0AAD6IU44_DREDA|nr:hypothetical protein Dda_6402 [Drechslerella dactyloides]